MILQTVTTMFRSWWFDPLIASLSFFTSVMVYSHYEFLEGKSCYDNWFQFLWGKGVDKTDERPNLSMSLFAYWVGVLIWVQLVPPPGASIDQSSSSSMSSTSTMMIIPDGIPNSAEGVAYLAMEVVSGIFLYDTIFFFIHFAMHECKFIAKICNHHEHHKATKNLEARHVLRHSLFDGVLQVVVNIAVQRHTPWGNVKSRLARVLHNIIVTAMLTESHCASSYPNMFRWWCVGVRDHRNHHLSFGGRKSLNGSVHCHNRYQQFFGHWDYLRECYFVQKSKTW